MRTRITYLALIISVPLVFICCSRKPEAAKTSEKTRGEEMRQRYSSPESLSKITGLRVPPDLPQVIRRTNALSSGILQTAKATSGHNLALKSTLEHTDLCDPTASSEDFRTRNLMTPVKDQGECGACWAFATNGVLESSYMALRKEHISASEQELISCSSAGSCSGGWWAFDFLLKPGIESSSAYSYEGKDAACKMPISTEFRALSTGYVETDIPNAQTTIPGNPELKSALCKHGPLAVAFRATPTFIGFGWDHHDANSVFEENDTGPVNHGIVVVGWDDSKQTWIIKNSWGTNWGENGYMRIKYGTNSIGLGAAWAESWPKDYAPPTRVRTIFKRMPQTTK